MIVARAPSSIPVDGRTVRRTGNQQFRHHIRSLLVFSGDTVCMIRDDSEVGFIHGGGGNNDGRLGEECHGFVLSFVSCAKFCWFFV